VRPWLLATLLVLAFACGSSESSEERVDAAPPIDPLPGQTAAESEAFVTSGTCAQCHAVGESDTQAMKTAAGDDVSPLYLWRSTMMALASRDPFYLAAFQHELAVNPDDTTAIENLCTRCHGPAGNEAGAHGGQVLTFAELTAGESTEARLARDGVTCSLCHQISGTGLGTDSSFSGGFSVGFVREIYGPHTGVNEGPMQMFVQYTPTFAEHVTESELCATCHTVIVTGAAGTEVIEQSPYLEWQSSVYATPAQLTTCQDCHMPTVDDDGNVIRSAISKFPDGLSNREPYGQHTFLGGNSFMLRLLAANTQWAGITSVPEDELLAAAARNDEHLGTAAAVELSRVERNGDQLEIDVQVSNLAGHKLPTGYPTRRVWIHLEVRDSGGALVFESGDFDDSGRLSADDASPRPHYDTITAPGQVQVYEQVFGDRDGRPTFSALAAATLLKDNRLLPQGFTGAGARIAPVGTSGDSDFGAGTDRVHYRIATSASSVSVRAELLYQSVPPEAIDEVASFAESAATRFVDMARGVSNQPVVLATASQ
jgi:hypothetical protein